MRRWAFAVALITTTLSVKADTWDLVGSIDPSATTPVMGQFSWGFWYKNQTQPYTQGSFGLLTQRVDAPLTYKTFWYDDGLPANDTNGGRAMGYLLIGNPGPGVDVGRVDGRPIFRFTAPFAGAYDLTGSFRWIGGPNATDWTLYKNGSLMGIGGSVSGPPGSSTSSVGFTSVPLLTGDVIDFMATGNDQASAYLNLTYSALPGGVSPVPEPSTWIAVACGIVAGLVRHRRGRG